MALDLFGTYMLNLSRVVLIALAIAILVRCLRSMLREHYDPEV